MQCTGTEPWLCLPIFDLTKRWSKLTGQIDLQIDRPREGGEAFFPLTRLASGKVVVKLSQLTMCAFASRMMGTAQRNFSFDLKLPQVFLSHL